MNYANVTYHFSPKVGAKEGQLIDATLFQNIQSPMNVALEYESKFVNLKLLFEKHDGGSGVGICF